MIFLILSFTAQLFFQTAVASDWVPLSDYNGVQVFRKEIENSDTLAYRSISILPAPPVKIAEILSDVSRMHEWAEYVKKAQVIRTLSTGERIEYIETSPPWPIADRDLVLLTKQEYDAEKQQIVIHIRSVDESTKPLQKGKVRAFVYSAGFILTPVDGGNKTQMIAEVHADPKGSIPHWIVNLVQRSAPRRTVERMLMFLKRSI